MAYIEIEPKTNFLKFEKEEDELEGVLIDTSKSTTYPDIDIYSFQLISAKINGKLIDIEAFAEDKIGRIFSSAILAQRMDQIKIGSKVKIIYKGKTIKTQYGKAKNYKVYVDTSVKPK